MKVCDAMPVKQKGNYEYIVSSGKLARKEELQKEEVFNIRIAISEGLIGSSLDL